MKKILILGRTEYPRKLAAEADVVLVDFTSYYRVVKHKNKTLVGLSTPNLNECQLYLDDNHPLEFLE